MEKKIILIPPCFTYGDILSIISMVYFLTNYYDKVYLYIIWEGENYKMCNYYKFLFENCDKFKKQIYIIENNQIYEMLSQCEFGEYHICNTHTGCWSKPNFMFSDIKTIDKTYYFNDLNPLYNYLTIDSKYLRKPNCHLPNRKLEINHLFYYKLLGLNSNVRMDFFNYTRDLSKELTFKKNILKQFNINEEEKYNIVYSAGKKIDFNIFNTYTSNKYKFIDIHCLADFPGWLLKLIEDSETINLVEGSTVNFLYHCQYKNIIQLSNPVNLHAWLNNRSWPQYNMCEGWKMMMTPKLENWNIITNSI
jgi:hypothetical protein